jgi:Tetracyclin repressor-like, C-terminal domain
MLLARGVKRHKWNIGAVGQGVGRVDGTLVRLTGDGGSVDGTLVRLTERAGTAGSGREERWCGTRPVLGPNGLVVVEHVLEVLAAHPADTAAKLDAFAMLTSVSAVFVLNEMSGGRSAQQRNAAYLQQVLAAGQHPLTQLLTSAPAGGQAHEDRYASILGRILTGILAPC